MLLYNNLYVRRLHDTSGISEDRRENISIVYTYLGTGDSWSYNADTWRYPASMYKVPMLMVLAERVAKGELTQESDIGGMTLAKTEDLVLIWSNNEQAHVVRKYLGGDPVARKLYQAYSPQEESYYHSDFIDYCYFTARYMDDVMQTLYNNQSNFPNIMDCLKVAMPDRYYHLNIDPSYVVAQKYGTFKEFNNNTGIIFTPNPFYRVHQKCRTRRLWIGECDIKPIGWIEVVVDKHSLGGAIFCNNLAQCIGTRERVHIGTNDYIRLIDSPLNLMLLVVTVDNNIV